MPAKLFKYQPFNVQTLANLKQRALWFSAPARFNDPFDCATKVTATTPTDEELARAVEYMRRAHGIDPALYQGYDRSGRISDEFRRALLAGAQTAFDNERAAFYHSRGVACLTTKPDDLLMWSHYADGHRGFCLEFDGSVEPFSKARQVRYSDSLPALSIMAVLGDQDAGAMLDAMVLMKAKCWMYEDEWRLIHAEESTQYTYHWKNLAGVHFGAAMPDEHIEIVALVLRDSPTKMFRMTRLDDAFAVKSLPLTYTPFQYDSQASHSD